VANLRQALERITELQSRKAILRTMILHIETLYVSSDTEPEAHIRREDGGLVPQQHIRGYLLDLETALMGVESELGEWEKMPVGENKAQELKIAADIRKEASKSRKARKERTETVAKMEKQ
jgi:hypothetical protein